MISNKRANHGLGSGDRFERLVAVDLGIRSTGGEAPNTSDSADSTRKG